MIGSAGAPPAAVPCPHRTGLAVAGVAAGACRSARSGHRVPLAGLSSVVTVTSMETSPVLPLSRLLDSCAHFLAAVGVIDTVPMSGLPSHLPVPRPVPSPQLLGRDRSAAELARRWNLGPLVPCGGGSDRWTTYVADRHILRLFNAPATDTVTRLLRVADLPGGGEIVAYDPDGLWLLERRHPGVLLRHAWPVLTSAARRRCAEDLAAWRAEWAAVTPTAADMHMGHVSVSTTAHQRLPADVAADAVTFLNREPRWIHGDLHAGNILIDPSTGVVTAVVDFEHAACVDDIWDAVRLTAVAAYQTSPEWVASFVTPVDPDRLTVALAATLTPKETGGGPDRCATRTWLRDALLTAAADALTRAVPSRTSPTST